MNLAMQTHRAMITLGLVVAAMLCVAAKTASTADLHASMPTNIAAPKTDARLGAVTQARIVLVSTSHKSRKLVRIATPNTNG
jgi:hypothetical protein